jgi:hypothetical protein
MLIIAELAADPSGTGIEYFFGMMGVSMALILASTITRTLKKKPLFSLNNIRKFFLIN